MKKPSAEELVSREIARFEARLILPERFSQAVKTDEVLQKIQKRYQRAIYKRMGYLMSREARKTQHDARKLFLKQCQEAYAPVVETEAKCFPLEE
jgi:hypothetical protein